MVTFLILDVAVVDHPLNQDHALPDAVNVPAGVANEAEIVTVTSRERRKESDHGHALGHAHHRLHDQHHGHALHQQLQNIAIKRRNRVDKVAHQALTELCDTEKLFFPMLSAGVCMYSACYSNKLQKERHFNIDTRTSRLDCFTLRFKVVCLLCLSVVW